MVSTTDALAKARKEKRWLIFKKPSVIYKGQTIIPSEANPLKIQVKASDGETAAIMETVTGDPWILAGEIGSFEMAKKFVIELAETLPLGQLKLSRAVDLYTVLYPIS